MSVSARRVLVTGADGFIGSHLVERLVGEGWQVRAFVLYNSLGSWGWLDNVSKQVLDAVEVFPGDIRDRDLVTAAVRDCDYVAHLAALISIPYSYQSQDSFVQTNIVGTLNVLDAARAHGVERLVHTSTSEVYGTALTVPISEEHPLQAQSPYSATKIGADHLALSFYRTFDLPVTVLRPFNCFGPRQSARAVIPTVITQIASGKRRIRLGALDPRRDFTYVIDTAQAFVRALESPACDGEVINVGSGFDVSIGETVELVARLMQTEIEVEEEAQRVRPEKSEVQRLLADSSKAADLLKWSPEYPGVAGFERRLGETIEWFERPENLVRYRAERYTI